MKKSLYFIILIAALFVDSLLMISLWDSSLYIPIAVSIAAVVGLQIWQLVWYLKATDSAVKGKILLNSAVIMAIPMAVFFVTYVVIGIAFVFAFTS